MLVSVKQKTRESLSKALAKYSFSSLQKKLINDIPVTSKARSTRYFHLLFEKSGNSKDLKAVYVVRGKSTAEFVLAKYKGKWVWADEKGKISSSSEGFLRYPLSFKRLSSGFNPYRRHPITRRILGLQRTAQ